MGARRALGPRHPPAPRPAVRAGGDTVHDPNGWRTECLASVTVHDLPPTAQYQPAPTFDCGTNWACRPARHEKHSRVMGGDWDLGPRPARGSARRGSGTEPHPDHRCDAPADVPRRAGSCACRLWTGWGSCARRTNQAPTPSTHGVCRSPTRGQPVLIEDLPKSSLLRVGSFPESLRFASARGASRERCPQFC